MRACFICETPFQLLNVLNFVVNQKEYCFQHIDLFIGDKFNDYEKISARLEEQRIFNNIYKYSYSKEKNSFFSKCLFRYFYVIYPSLFINYAIIDTSKINNDFDYSYIFVSTLTRFGMAMIMSNPNAKTCYFDDGLGTYIGKIGIKSITKKRKLVYKVLRKDYRHLHPEVLYVNNMDMCFSQWDVPIRSLPSLVTISENFKEILYNVFMPPDPVYKEKKVILLSQPYYKIERGIKDNTDVVCENLNKKSYIVRLHPLEGKIENSSLIIDNSNTLWELICAEYISDDNILIGKCSTAQLVPKILFNKEPIVIFTYKLYTYISIELQKKYHEIYLIAKKSYKNSEKVIEIQNLNELKVVFNLLNI